MEIRNRLLNIQIQLIKFEILIGTCIRIESKVQGRQIYYRISPHDQGQRMGIVKILSYFYLLGFRDNKKGFSFWFRA